MSLFSLLTSCLFDFTLQASTALAPQEAACPCSVGDWSDWSSCAGDCKGVSDRAVRTRELLQGTQSQRLRERLSVVLVSKVTATTLSSKRRPCGVRRPCSKMLRGLQLRSFRRLGRWHHDRGCPLDMFCLTRRRGPPCTESERIGDTRSSRGPGSPK